MGQSALPDKFFEKQPQEENAQITPEIIGAVHPRDLFEPRHDNQQIADADADADADEIVRLAANAVPPALRLR